MKRSPIAVAVALLIALAAASPAAAVTRTFDGPGTDWNTAANWDTNSVPTSADDAVIPSGFNVSVTTCTTACAANSIDLQGSLTVDNTLTIGTLGDATPETSSLAAQISIKGSALLRLNETTNWSEGNWFMGDFAEPAGVAENAGTLNITGNATANDGGGAVVPATLQPPRGFSLFGGPGRDNLDVTNYVFSLIDGGPDPDTLSGGR